MRTSLIINRKSYNLKSVINKWPNKRLHELLQQGERTIITGSHLYFFDENGVCTGIANKEALKKLEL